MNFLVILAIVFTSLKLMDYIDWNWFLVLVPLWLHTAITLMALTMILILTIIEKLQKLFKRKS
jgi:hypothetical protein